MFFLTLHPPDGFFFFFYLKSHQKDCLPSVSLYFQLSFKFERLKGPTSLRYIWSWLYCSWPWPLTSLCCRWDQRKAGLWGIRLNAKAKNLFKENQLSNTTCPHYHLKLNLLHLHVAANRHPSNTVYWVESLKGKPGQEADINVLLFSSCQFCLGDGGVSVNSSVTPVCLSVFQVLSICPKDMRADICVHLNRKVCYYGFPMDPHVASQCFAA